MTTDEIIRRLKNILRDPRWPDLCASAEDIYEVDAALNAAIQAVKTVAAVNAAYEERDCDTCWNRDDPKRTEGAYSTPCYDCLCCEKWSLRWPLEEEETQ